MKKLNYYSFLLLKNPYIFLALSIFYVLSLNIFASSSIAYCEEFPVYISEAEENTAEWEDKRGFFERNKPMPEDYIYTQKYKDGSSVTYHADKSVEITNPNGYSIRHYSDGREMHATLGMTEPADIQEILDTFVRQSKSGQGFHGLDNFMGKSEYSSFHDSYSEDSFTSFANPLDYTGSNYDEHLPTSLNMGVNHCKELLNIINLVTTKEELAIKSLEFIKKNIPNYMYFTSKEDLNNMDHIILRFGDNLDKYLLKKEDEALYLSSIIYYNALTTQNCAQIAGKADNVKFMIDFFYITLEKTINPDVYNGIYDAIEDNAKIKVIT